MDQEKQRLLWERFSRASSLLGGFTGMTRLQEAHVLILYLSPAATEIGCYYSFVENLTKL